MTSLSGDALLNMEERRGYSALIALGVLLGVVAGMVVLDFSSESIDSEPAVLVVCAVLGGLLMLPFARRESRVWVRRRRGRDAE
ncbi:MAG: hypothetical protein ACXWW7_05555 [Nocardioides sp.]